MSKSQQLLQATHDNANGNGNEYSNCGNGSSESYSSASSFTESYSSSSDLANWEEYVTENGTLFYAEYSLNAHHPHNQRVEFARNSSLNMAKKSAINARKQEQSSSKAKSLQRQSSRQEDSFKFSYIREHGAQDHQQQQKELELIITAADRYRFGRRSTAAESILGFRVVPYSDQPEYLMVDGFVHDMPAMQEQQQQQQRQSQLPPIKRGDWFKSLDESEVRTSNIDELLLQFVEPTKVSLKFQGPALNTDGNKNANQIGDDNCVGGNSAGSTDLCCIENFAMFAELFEKLQLPAVTVGNADHHTTSPVPFLMLIMPPECYQNEQYRDSMFVFPELDGNNFLYKSRGSFLTLNAVLDAEMQTKPLSSKLLVNDVQYYICYRTLNTFLVLFAYAATYQSIMEANLRSDELVSHMRFALPSLSLEHLSHSNVSCSALRLFLYHFCTIQRTRILSKHLIAKQDQPRCSDGVHHCLFEELLRESRTLPLPKEAQLRIFDALSEMEAMDYRNWNDEPLNTHREFFIHGSILYYDHFLLRAQIPAEMRTRIESFLRCRGIFDFIIGQCVKELYVWEEIIPPECEGGPQNGRFFLTICSRSHLILAVVLKIFDAPDLAPNTIIPPSLFYIEEIQETLDHLISCGIESLAMFWSISNKRPEALNILDTMTIGNDTLTMANERDSNKLETFIKQKLTPSTSGNNLSQSQSQRSISYDEETHLCSSLGGSSIHSLTHSEDDSSRKRLTGNDNASDSGSDWDNFVEQNPLYYGIDGELQSQMTESLWKEINNVVPVKISAGWKNAVFHYVYVDNANGTVFCPLKLSMVGGSSGNNNTGIFPFLSEIRKAYLIIHNVLQNTKSFRCLLAEESSGSSVQAVASNRFVGLAIKEHGLTIGVRDDIKCTSRRDCADTESNNPTPPPRSTGIFKGNFVVVGRLFLTPTREVYICHRPDVPQNLVEMAFRLSFFSVG